MYCVYGADFIDSMQGETHFGDVCWGSVAGLELAFRLVVCKVQPNEPES